MAWKLCQFQLPETIIQTPFSSPTPSSTDLGLSSLLKRPVIPSHLFQLPPQPAQILQPSLIPFLNPSFPLLFPQNPLLAQPDLTQYLNFLM